MLAATDHGHDEGEQRESNRRAIIVHGNAQSYEVRKERASIIVRLPRSYSNLFVTRPAILLTLP
jgi:hypothetical protein